MKYTHFIFFLCLTFVMASCHKDSDNSTNVSTTTKSNPSINNARVGSYWGIVVDEVGKPISDATVVSYDKQTRTNAQGYFKIDDAILSPTGTYTRAMKPGYFDGSDLVFAAGDDAHTRIVMMRMESPTTVDASAGGEARIVGGGRLQFPENSIVDAKNNPYSGSMLVYAKNINADQALFGSLMPGGLYAKDKEGKNVVLGSAGMIAVELRDQSGNELQIKKGKKVVMTYPIARSQRDGAPTKMPLWSFDDDAGVWIEEGVATREGDTYIGELSHFSFWNLDYPFPLVKIKGVLHFNGKPVAYQHLKIRTDIYSVGYGVTDKDGKFCGLVPKGEPLSLSIVDICTQDNVKNIGVLEEDADIGTINFEVPTTTITGTVKCLEENVENGNVYISLGTIDNPDALDTLEWQENIIVPFQGGKYIYNSLSRACYNDAVIQAVDTKTNKASKKDTIIFSENPSVINHDFQLCTENCNLQATFTSNASEVCVLEDLRLSIDVTGGKAPYTYAWELSESTTNYINYHGVSKNYCVVVTDAEGCSASFCREVGQFNFLNVYGLSVFDDCEDETVNVEFFVAFPELPIHVIINSESRKITELDSFKIRIEDVPEASLYDVTVVDSRGCDGNIKTAYTSNDPLFRFDQDSYHICTSELTLSTTSLVNTPLTYEWSTGSTESSIVVTSRGNYCLTAKTETGCTYKKCTNVSNYNFVLDSIIPICDNGSWVIPGDILQNPVYTNNTASNLIQLLTDSIMYVEGKTQEGCDVLKGYNIFSSNALRINKVQDISCVGCTDGYIEYTIHNDVIFCENCQISEVKIFDVTDYSDNKVDDNANQKLGKGSYVLIGYTDSGCVIVNQPFAIE